ncbi:MAG TPA: hypothetical protein VKU36_01875 [Candidatus Babeliales bacterium]|nr:hypothetical protein [Candidatus Babeliales bacterium]
MKNYIYIFSIFSLVGSFLEVTADWKKATEAAVVFSFLRTNGMDKGVANRGHRHACFYSTKRSEDFLSKENAIDYGLYPIVDIVVGQGMSKLDGIESIHALTNNISKGNREFLANNIQLITSAAIIEALRIDSQKGMNNIDYNDAKKFGKACATQVGVDAVNGYIIAPAVKKLVKDEDSWTALGLQLAGSYVLSSVIQQHISKF